jgi:uncharacterized protein YoxC
MTVAVEHGPVRRAKDARRPAAASSGAMCAQMIPRTKLDGTPRPIDDPAMIDLFADAGPLLLQVAAARDTVFTQALPPDRGWFEQLTAIAGGLMTIALLVLAVALTPAAWSFRKSYKKASALLDRIYGDINPLMRHASSIADNVDYVTTALRSDVQRVNATIAAANQRINQAVQITEHRLNELNALLSVVQQEAEQLFVGTAATVRGVKTGAAAFASDSGPELASDEDGELADLLYDEEIYDGDDDDTDGSARGAAPAARSPRVRRRHPR